MSGRQGRANQIWETSLEAAEVYLAELLHESAGDAPSPLARDDGKKWEEETKGRSSHRASKDSTYRYSLREGIDAKKKIQTRKEF